MSIVLQKGFKRFIVLKRGEHSVGNVMMHFTDRTLALEFLRSFLHEPHSMMCIRELVGDSSSYGNVSRSSDHQVLKQFVEELLLGQYRFVELSHLERSPTLATAFETASGAAKKFLNPEPKKSSQPNREELHSSQHRLVKLSNFERSLTGAAASATAAEVVMKPSKSEPMKFSQPSPEAFQRKVEKSWIEIRLVDENQTPVPNEYFRIISPNGMVLKEGKLDNKGQARVSDIDQGTCRVTFVNLDKDTWMKV